MVGERERECGFLIIYLKIGLLNFKFKVNFTSFYKNIHNLLTLNDSNSSKNEYDEFFQAS